MSEEYRFLVETQGPKAKKYDGTDVADAMAEWSKQISAGAEYVTLEALRLTHVKKVVADQELDFLRSYVNGPRIWDGVAVLPLVYAMEDKGFIEVVGTSGAYQLTGAGRKELGGQ